jgi:hypothetical protein
VPQITLEGHGMSKDAQTKLEGMKKNNPNDTKELSFSQKKTDMMMLNQVKKEKTNERAQAQHWGAR